MNKENEIVDLELKIIDFQLKMKALKLNIINSENKYLQKLVLK